MDNRWRRSIRAHFAARIHGLTNRTSLRPGGRTPDGLGRGVRSLLVVALVLGSSAVPTAAQTDETTTTTAPSSTPSTLSEEDRAKKARAAANLNEAKAADSEIAAALTDINEAAQATQSKIDQAQARLEAAQDTMTTATEELTRMQSEQSEIEDQLRAKAVEGFKSGGLVDPGPFFSQSNINQSIRQSQLLEQANRSTAELLEDLRALLEDERVIQAEAAQAARDAATLEAELQGDLEILREQSTTQLRLKAEAESRINKWEAELTAYAAEDEGIKKLIADTAASPVTAALPAEPSLLGYQWPLSGRVTSGYGYRIHPVYGTRKLHSGIDISAPRGTPIATTSGGVVISSGWRGGYGNAVIVDHGGGFTSLYAHLSALHVSVGQSLERGDVVGLVGATGTATGNHLHFEIRVNGTATDPVPYLP